MLRAGVGPHDPLFERLQIKPLGHHGFLKDEILFQIWHKPANGACENGISTLKKYSEDFFIHLTKYKKTYLILMFII